VSTRRWQRFPVDLPVHVVVRNGIESLKVPGCGTELGRGGMALYAGLTLQPGDPIEIEFQAPCHLRVAGIIRNRTAYCFGLEFLSRFHLKPCSSCVKIHQGSRKPTKYFLTTDICKIRDTQRNPRPNAAESVA